MIFDFEKGLPYIEVKKGNFFPFFEWEKLMRVCRKQNDMFYEYFVRFDRLFGSPTWILPRWGNFVNFYFVLNDSAYYNAYFSSIFRMEFRRGYVISYYHDVFKCMSFANSMVNNDIWWLFVKRVSWIIWIYFFVLFLE